MSTEQLVHTRVIAAPPAEVFAVLADPVRHQETEPGDWVRDPIDPESLTEVGQTFGMRMHHWARGGDYEMWNQVTAIEPDRVIAWAPGGRDETGTVTPARHEWRYDLQPDGDSTRVTFTYDWSGMPHQIR